MAIRKDPNKVRSRHEAVPQSPVLSAFVAGTSSLQAKHNEEDQAKLGKLRAGSGGLALGDGRVTNCQRKALLRYLGKSNDSPVTDFAAGSKLLMFEGGVTNEDSWAANLAAGWAGVIKRETEIPVTWELPNGEKVTGRPDIVLCNTAGVPQHGIELKQCSSAWTVRDIISGKPKLDHLRQAGMYLWKLSEQHNPELTYELWYTNRVNFAVGGDFMLKLFPQPGDKGSEYCKYKAKKLPNGEYVQEIKDVLPFIKGFLLRWTDEGRLQYREVPHESREWEGWTDSLVTKQAMTEFYLGVTKQLETKTLGPRPVALDPQGKSSFNPCNYCPLVGICESHESKGLDKWLGAVGEYLDSSVDLTPEE